MALSMKRTTSGLLQGKQTDVTARHLKAAVHFLEHRVKDAGMRQALRLDRAKDLVKEAEAGLPPTVGSRRVMR